MENGNNLVIVLAFFMKMFSFFAFFTLFIFVEIPVKSTCIIKTSEFINKISFGAHTLRRHDASSYVLSSRHIRPRALLYRDGLSHLSLHYKQEKKFYSRLMKKKKKTVRVRNIKNILKFIITNIISIWKSIPDLLSSYSTKSVGLLSSSLELYTIHTIQ